MARYMISLALSLLCLNATLGQEAGRKIAIIVGVNQYDDVNLNNLQFAVNDAEQLGEVLRGAKFDEVHILSSQRKDEEKPTRAAIDRKIDAILPQLTKQDMLILAFAGHGKQSAIYNDQKQFVRDDAFFCPSDAKVFNNETLISISTLLTKLNTQRAGTTLLLIDACRNDPDTTRGIDGDTVKALPLGMSVLFSCSRDQRAFESAQLKHGVFFHFLIQGLQGKAANDRGAVTWNRLVTHVQERMQDEFDTIIPNSPVKQLPHAVTNINTIPVLIPKPLNPAPTPPAPVPMPVTAPMPAPVPVVEPMPVAAPAPVVDPMVEAWERERSPEAAYALLNNHEYDDASAAFDEILQQQPQHISAMLGRARIVIQRCDHERYRSTINELSKVLTTEPRNAEAWGLRAWLRLELKQDKEAIADTDQALAIDSANRRAYQVRARYLITKRQYASAKSHLDAVGKFGRIDATTACLWSDLAVAQGGADVALEWAVFAVKTDGRDPMARCTLANVYGRSQKWDAARRECDNALSIDPKNGCLWNQSAYCRYLRSDYSGAIRDLNEAIRLNPNCSNHYGDRGTYLFNLNEFAQALDANQRALKLDPDNVEAIGNMSVHLINNRQYADARAILNRGLQLNPEMAGLYHNQGSLSLLEGKFREAIDDLTQSIRLGPTGKDISEAYCQRAICYAELGQKRIALQDVETALRIDPRHAEAAKMRDYLQTETIGRGGMWSAFKQGFREGGDRYPRE